MRARASLRRFLLGVVVGALVACGGARPAPPPPAPLPRDAYAHYLAGKAALFDEDFAAAVSHLRAAAAAAPAEPELAVALIAALAAAEDPAAAAEARRALERWPSLPVVWRAWGDLLAAGKRHAEAAAAFRRAVALDPSAEESHVGLISSLQHLDPSGGGAAVLAAVQALIARVPTSASGHYLLAQLHLQRGEREPAFAELRTVLGLQPGHLDARSLLAEELHRAGRTPEAIAEARSAFDRSGEDVELVSPLLRILCAAGDRRSALDLLGLYDDAERSLADLAVTARLALAIEDSALAARLVDRAASRAAATTATEEDPEAVAAAASSIAALRNELLLSRLTAPWSPPSLRCSAALR
jgi:tetratricopeptide (TPR) repeat protein